MAEDIEGRGPAQEPPDPDPDLGDIEDELDDPDLEDDAAAGDDDPEDGDAIEDEEGHAGDQEPGEGDERVA